MKENEKLYTKPIFGEQPFGITQKRIIVELSPNVLLYYILYTSS